MREESHEVTAMFGRALLYAVPVSSFVMGLFYYWFGVADRYAIFLYNHLGAGPFDGRTVSRYWMSGLVASGAVMVFYAIVNWFGGRIAGIRYRRYAPPPWWHVWLLCLPLLSIGIPWITMTVNDPVLPFPLAVGCTVATLTGLFLALMPGRMAAQQPGELGWLAAIGLGLAPSLLLLRAIELAWKSRLPAMQANSIGLGSTLIGGAIACGIAYLHAMRRHTPWQPGQLLIGALMWSYLLAPLAHHLLLTPPAYRYISVADNFFASTFVVQVLCFLILGVQAQAVSWLHRYACSQTATDSTSK